MYRKMFWTEPGRMWQGFSLGLITRQVGPMGIRIASYQLFQSTLNRHNAHDSSSVFTSGGSFQQGVLCGAMAAMLAALVEQPVTNARHYAASDTAFGFLFSAQARSLVAHHGVASLYSGVLRTLMVDMPFFGLLFPTYQWLRRVRSRRVASEQEPNTDAPPTLKQQIEPVNGSIIAGALASVVATWATTPLRIARYALINHNR
jgi:hypothetical protein